ADGNLAVNEQIAYDFGAAAHHGIFRDLVEGETYDAHHDRRYHISGVTARADNNPARVDVSHTGSYLHVRIGDPNSTVPGVHTYTIEYRLDGAARTFADHQELYWDAIGNQWPVPIDRATVTLSGPSSSYLRTACCPDRSAPSSTSMRTSSTSPPRSSTSPCAVGSRSPTSTATTSSPRRRSPARVRCFPTRRP